MQTRKRQRVMAGREAAEGIQRRLFSGLTKNITDEELKKIKLELKLKEFGSFGAGELQREINTSEDVFERLKRKGLIKLGDYRLLRKLFKDIESTHLCEEIDVAENHLHAMNWPVLTGSFQQEMGQPHGGRGYPQYPLQHHYPPPSYIPPSGYRATPVPEAQLSDAYTRPHPAPHPAPHSAPHFAAHHSKAMPDALPSLSSQLSADEVFEAPATPSFDHRTYYQPGRGYVLFINNLFIGEENQRTGAEKDEDNIQELFDKQLKTFHLQYKKNVTKGELESYLGALKNTLGTGSYASFMLVLGSHGQPQVKTQGGPTKDAVLMADDKWMLVDDIIAHFHGDKIPAMKECPKIFIIQSCRGKEKQRSVSYSDQPHSGEAPPSPQEPSQDMLTRPVNSDILIAYATSQGTRAWRNQDEGSWFVSDLCTNIRKYYDKEHILDILVRVNNAMTYREATEDRAKQMPCFICTFTKRFMFK